MSVALPLLLTSLVLGQTWFTPAEAEAIFAEGNAAWARGDFEAAEERYKKLLDRGLGGPDVLYNLATTHLAQEELGEAILYFERAKRLGAGGADLESNLALAREKQRDRQIHQDSHRTLLARVTEAFPLRPLALFFAFFWSAGFGLLVARRLMPRLQGPLTLTLAAALLLGSGASGMLLGAHAWRLERVQEAVVLAPTLAVHDLPDVSSNVSFEVHAGLIVRQLDAAGAFVKIRLPNGAEGWAQPSHLAMIQAP